MSQPTLSVPAKSSGTAWLLWLFFGGLGAHQFYLGRPGRGISYLFTLGWLTVGLWIDLFSMGKQVRSANERALAEARASA